MSDVDAAVLTCTHCDAPVHLTQRNRIVNTDGTPHTCETADGVREKGASDRTREAPGVGQSGGSAQHETPAILAEGEGLANHLEGGGCTP